MGGHAILIVSFNTRELTLACLASVSAEGPVGAGADVVVVDNASTDGSAEAIAAAFPQVELVRLDQNVGFARANNLAAGRAGDCEFLLLLNPDTVVRPGAIGRLVAFAEAHPEASIFGGRTVFADGSLNAGSCWRRPTMWSAFCIASGLTSLFGRWGLFSPESYGRWKRDTVREVDIVSGCFFLIRRRVWDELGGFDTAFFMYGEDADLCLRARKLGHKCLVCPDAEIVHHGGASERVRANKMVRLFRAKAMLFERHWSPAAAKVGVALLDLWAASRVAALGVLRAFRPRLRESYRQWREICRQRAAWHETPQPAAVEAASAACGSAR